METVGDDGKRRASAAAVEEEEVGVVFLLLPCPIRGVEEEEGVEVDLLVCSALPEVLHGVAATVALSCSLLVDSEKKKGQGERRKEERRQRGGEG